MNREDDYSEEQISAFVDGELEAQEKSRLLSESGHSQALDQRLCQQRKLKELVKNAYEDIPQPDPLRGSRGSPRSLVARSLVASVLILLGVGAGFLAHRQLDQFAAGGPHPVASVQSENYLLHVSDGSLGAMQAVLERARVLADDDAPGTHRVEIVANEDGLNLLRSDITPFAGEISALADRNVVFYACSRAIERLERNGVKVVLVPEANTRYTALDRVVKRMQEGWHYQKI